MKRNAEWINLDNRHQIVFAGLSSGKHELYVQSKTQYGNWVNASNQFEFDIEENFWVSDRVKILFASILGLLLLILFLQEYRRRKAQQLAFARVQESEDRLKTALKASGQGLWYWNKAEGRILRFNVAHLFHPKYENIEDLEAIEDIIHDKDVSILKSQREAFINGKRESEVQYRVKAKNNQWRWIIDKGQVIEFDSEGNVARAAGTYTDITELKRSQLELRLSDQVIQSMTEAVVVMREDKKVSFVNPAFCRLTGCEINDVRGQRLIKLRSEKHADQFYENFWNEYEEDGVWYGEVWMRTKSGKDILCALEAFQLSDEELNEKLFVLIFSNITERRKAEEELSYLARYDTMTGLPNRSLMQDRLSHALALAKRHDHKLALMFMDLDGFKKINDSLGHQVGDLLLKNTASLIQSCIRQEDTLARLSGDEFILLIEEYRNKDQLVTVAEKILSTLEKPMSLAGHQVVVTCSLGISQFPTDASEADNLMKYADTAMYYAKSQGKNQFAFYQEEMHEQVMQRLYIENHLRNAINNNELKILYQPLIEFKSGSVIGMEALLRWQSPELGEVYPGDFIALAEETGLIIDIGYYVMQEVCKQINTFEKELGRKISISVNVSVKQLYGQDFIYKLEKLMKKYDIPPNLLKLEITESMLMANAAQTQNVFLNLKQLGALISIDDFGTGYSSLSYLNKFDIDELKIDKEFIADIYNARKEDKVIDAIVALAKSLDMKVVAEGVESKQQFEYLTLRNCDYYQGYLFSRPITARQMIDYIESFDWDKYSQ